MAKEVNERKWEIDSLCYPLRLIYRYWRETGDTSVFDDLWEKAMRTVLQTFREQQRKENVGPYSFERKSGNSITTLLNGTGNPVNPVGMVVSIQPIMVCMGQFSVRRTYHKDQQRTSSAAEGNVLYKLLE